MKKSKLIGEVLREYIYNVIFYDWIFSSWYEKLFLLGFAGFNSIQLLIFIRGLFK